MFRVIVSDDSQPNSEILIHGLTRVEYHDIEVALSNLREFFPKARLAPARYQNDGDFSIRYRLPHYGEAILMPED